MPKPTLQRNLQATRISGSYLKVLGQAWTALIQFCISQGFAQPSTVGKNLSLANYILVEFIQHLYDTNNTLHLARHAVLAVQTVHRELKRHLKPAWDSIGSWTMDKEVSLRKPLPLLVLQAATALARALALDALLKGNSSSGEWLLVATLLDTGFYALLRPEEILKLSRKCVSFDSALRDGKGWASLAIENPKNRRSMGRIQYACVRSQRVSQWLQRFGADLNPQDTVWPYNRHRMVKRFAELMSLLHLEHCHFTLGSLRAGGSSHYFQNGVEPTRLKYWGRWKS